MSGAVTRTREWHRIDQLPKRDPRIDWQQQALALTERLKMPGGTMVLRPTQAQALTEFAQCRGLFGAIVVGGGKTLLSLLAPQMIGAQRPVLLLPAVLVEKTKNEQRILLRHWNLVTNITMLSYEAVSRDPKLLMSFRPDCIGADEVHKLKNPKAGVTRRVKAYFDEYPETPFMAISGSVMRKSLKDFIHLLRWALKAGAPVPDNWQECELWANALDEDTNVLDSASPGALLDWCDEPGLEELVQARRGFRNRLICTPGVVATGSENVEGCSLFISAGVYPVNAATEENFLRLRGIPKSDEYPGWETPDGYPFSTAPEKWMYARELAIGLHYLWDPRPPEEWKNARRAWAARVRYVLQNFHIDGVDTEATVAEVIDSGRVPDPDNSLATWRRIGCSPGSFKPNVIYQWHDDSALNVCANWMQKHKGIVWVEHVFFGGELSRRTGVPYFGAQAQTEDGCRLEDLARQYENNPRLAPQPIICSIAACSTGLNLQYGWNRNLITACPSASLPCEQLIGRTHRPGQRKDEVYVDIMLGCSEHYQSLLNTMATGTATLDMLGQEPKISLAQKDFPSEIDIRTETGYRWMK